MEPSDPPRNWSAPFLLLLFIWSVGRKSGEFSPKHCEIHQIGQDDSDDSFLAEMGDHDLSLATTLPTLNTHQVSGQSPSRAARMLSKKRCIFKKTICDGFPHFPQILRDAVKTRSDLVRGQVHTLNYGALRESWHRETKSFCCELLYI